MTAAPADLPALDAVLAKAGHENFAVAAWFLPATLRADLLAIYGFARFIDDIGDEADLDRSTRLRLLDLADADLTRLFADAAPRPASQPDPALADNARPDSALPDSALLPAIAALRPAVAAGRLPEEPFRRLIEANRLDQRASRYATFDDLRHYCTLSADPVGRLVLAAMGLATPERITLSDQICTGLQLAEHWQDVAEDRGRGRIYLPQEDLIRFGVGEEDLHGPHAGRELTSLMTFEVARAHELLDAGAPLVRLVPGRAKLAIAGFVAGGRAALHAIEAAGYDVLAGAPKPTKPRLLREAVAVLAHRRPASAR